MAFLNDNSKFPPKVEEYYYNKINEWSAWYSGDSQRLLDYYAVECANIGPGPESEPERFWARLGRSKDDNDGAVHMPVAGDIAATSANLLFSESPRIKYDENTEGGKRIKEFIDNNGFFNILLEGAEISAAISGCILKIDIEPLLEKIPLVSVISPLQFFPTFWRGRLWEVLFFRVVKETESGAVYRLFENRRRENGALIIEYQLHKGTIDKVGKQLDPSTLPETENLKLDPVTYNNIDGLGCIYIPNMKPNKLMIGSALGINDYSSSLSMLDSIDFTWTSWMRDIELGMAQIFVDEELLTRNKSDVAGELNYLNKFDKFMKTFIKLNLTSWRMGGESGTKPIDSIQFNIRVDEHSKTVDKLLMNIVSQCGYSPQTFGLGEYGTAQSGTALRIRENKSQLTREKKSRYWQPAIKNLLIQMQQMDQSSELTGPYDVEEVTVEIEDSIIVDARENSEIIRNLDQARAISNYQKVKLQHPDWNDDQIMEEVEKLNDESGVTGDIFSTSGKVTNTENEEESEEEINKKEV